MRKIRERSLRMESLEDRMLLAVTAGCIETAAAAAYVADPLPTEAAQLATPTGFRAASSVANKVDLSWDAVPNASGYTIYYQAQNAARWMTRTTTSTSFQVSGLNKNNLYSFKVVANGDGVNYTDSEESVVLQRRPDPSQAPVWYGTEVTTLSDVEDGVNMTLRQAVANASRTGETVTFADGLSGTIDLAPNGHIKDVYGDVLIDGDNRITITNTSTDGQGRLFLLYNYEEYISNISFKNITLTGATATTYKEFNRNGASGYTEDGAGFGSAIMLYSPNSKVSATFDNVTITDCVGTMNGTLYLYGVSDLTMTNCTITGNRTGNGGGFFLQACDNFTIADCVFDGNIANNNGGGVVLNSFTNGVLDNVQITNNACYGATDSSSLRGGGLYVDGIYEGGAAQYTVYSNLTLYDTVISGNVIDADPEAGEGLFAADGKGGGICVYNTNLTTNECVISDNHIVHVGTAAGGGVFAIYKDEYGYELISKNDMYRPYNGTVRFNMTYLTGNSLGTFDAYPGGVYGMTGGAVWASGNLIFVDSLVADNALYGNTASGMVASAVYDYCNNVYDSSDTLIWMSNMFAYYTTFAGNRAYSLNGRGLGEESGAFRDFGNSYFWGSTILGNQMVNMNGTVDDDSDDVVTDRDFFTFALEENLVALPRFLSCVINEDTMLYPGWFEEHADWHYGWLAGTYYDDAAFTQLSAGQAKNGGAYLKDDNVYVTDYRSLYNDYNAGDYTLAEGAAAIDAMNMDLWGHGFGYEFDIRGEGYYRLVNDIADIGVYEFQVAKPTFEVTITDYVGDYDGEAHTVTISGLEEGDVVLYSADGENYSETVVAYTDPGAYPVYVAVQRTGYEDFYGAGSVTINDVAPVEQLAAPVISTGNRGIYVSYGANRHNIQWGAVANASGYEVQYTTDGSTWTSVSASDVSAVIHGLTYGADVTYRVRALGTGSYTDSDWSASKTFNVCPMDINNDGDISGSDRNLLSSSWLSEEGDDEYQYYADINGDGDVSGADRNFISNNWLGEAGDDDLTYPRPLAADAVFAVYEAGDLDVDFDVF